jgi:hypothetical protein
MTGFATIPGVGAEANDKRFPFPPDPLESVMLRATPFACRKLEGDKKV